MKRKQMAASKSKCIETFDKALSGIEALMVSGAVQDYGKVHDAKSALYAAIERIGIRAEKTGDAQRMLRELMMILNEAAVSKKCEREVVRKMLGELKGKYRKDIFLS